MKSGRVRRVLAGAVEIAVLVLVAAFLVLALHGDHPGGSSLREYIVAHGSHETGAMNLVAAIYLGYRAFDTLGETIVLLLAVSGVLYFTERRKQ
jgi:multicomponent Na+:H+ antiporter subunit B